MERATAYAGLHKYDLALADLDFAQTISPDDPDARGLRGQIPATSELDQASAAHRGATLFDQGDYDGALAGAGPGGFAQSQRRPTASTSAA